VPRAQLQYPPEVASGLARVTRAAKRSCEKQLDLNISRSCFQSAFQVEPRL